jgi:hypothetical protein
LKIRIKSLEFLWRYTKARIFGSHERDHKVAAVNASADIAAWAFIKKIYT